jgi:oligopeptide transport system substrate-binding protein
MLLGVLIGFIFPLFAQTLDKEQIYRIGNGAEPRELDPQTSTGVPESRIVDNIFEGLTTLDPFTLEPRPGVAEKWEISKDQKTFTFHLRKNAKWSDGKAITAEDFVWSWQRAVSPELASEYAHQLYYLVNGEDINKGKKPATTLGVRAEGPHKLVVQLREPIPYFLRLTAFHTLYPVPKHVITKHKGLEWTKVGNLVTNGAFMIVEWRLNQHIKMIPNPHYWDKDVIKLKEVFFNPIENIETEDRTFHSGRLDITNEVPVLKIPRYMKEKKAKPKDYHPFRTDPYLGTYYYEINTKVKPLDDVRVRRALALVINRHMLVERVTLAGEVAATSFTPPGIPGYTPKAYLPVGDDAKKMKEAVAEAKNLLGEAGFADGKKFPKVDIMYNTSEKHQKIALAIQQMFRNELGIDIGMFNKEWKVYLNSRNKKDFAIARAGWIADYADPNTFLNMFVTGGPQNNTNWSNKDYDRLISEASKETDAVKRMQKFAEAEDILMREVPVIPIYYYANPYLLSKHVKMQDHSGKIIDYVSNVHGRYFLKNVVKVK